MKYKVITAVATEPVTLPQAKLHLRLITDPADVSAHPDDDAITGLIADARKTAEHDTGCALAPQTLEVAFDAFPRERFIRLPMGPASAVSSIKYDDASGVEQTLSTDDYSLSTYGDSNIINLSADAYWPSTKCKADAVRVQYVTGFASCPEQAVKAMKLMISLGYTGNSFTPADRDAIQRAIDIALNTIKVYG